MVTQNQLPNYKTIVQIYHQQNQQVFLQGLFYQTATQLYQLKNQQKQIPPPPPSQPIIEEIEETIEDLSPEEITESIEERT